MSKIRIPTADELDSRLGGVDRLLKAKEWERAVIVWVFTHDEGEGDRQVGDFTKKSISNFAALNISGLTQPQAVRRYRGAWESAIDGGYAGPAKPNDEVELPDPTTWPPDLRGRERLVRDDGRRAALESAAEAAGVSVASVLRAAASPDAVRVYNSTLPAEEKARQVAEYLDDPEVVKEVARDTVEKVSRAHHDSQPMPKAQPRDTTRDYDQMISQGVNLISVATAAETSGKWQPNPHSAKKDSLLSSTHVAGDAWQLSCTHRAGCPRAKGCHGHRCLQ